MQPTAVSQAAATPLRRLALRALAPRRCAAPAETAGGDICRRGLNLRRRATSDFYFCAGVGFRRLKSKPDQVASIAQTLKSTSPRARPTARTETCDRSLTIAEVFF